MSAVETSGQGAVIVARGARAVEALLLAELGAHAAAARHDPGLLARPVLVVVPSASLRLHVAARLVAEHGAVAGVAVVTLHRLAHEVVAAAGEVERRGAALFPVLVRRAARREPALAGFLEPLAEGYAGIVGTVRDLLDAGLEGAHAEPLDERLLELARGGEDAALARARAIVRVAAAVHGELDELGAGRTSTLLRRAAELLLEDAERVLPARAVLVHGFAEATGVATDVLEALLRRRAARVFVDEPPDPVAPARPDTGAAFARRLRERLAGYAAAEDHTGEDIPATGEVALRRAPGAYAEARAVAREVRELLDAGTTPESIGVVARDLAAVQLPLRQHFERLAIPYSALDAPGLRGPASRRVDALAALLTGGGSAPADAWLDVAYGAGGAAVGELRLALRLLGAVSVADVAALPLAERLAGATSLPLPVRRGFETATGGDEGATAGEAADSDAAAPGDEERSVYAERRRVSAARLERAVAAADRWCRAWAALPARATMRELAAALGRLLDAEVRRRPDGDGDPVRAALSRLAAELPPGLVVERDEALDLLREELRREGRVQPGGHGAGVQVLGVVEARARTFARLFVVGVNRDAFPRQVREDWLLPDRLRAALLPVLPDMPLKRTGHDEERYLFAELLSAAPAVTVSWTECDDDGKPTPASPLAERLCDGDHLRAPLLPDAWAAGGGIRPPHEHAVMAGLHGGRDRFAAVLPTALAAGACGAGVPPAPATERDAGAPSSDASAAALAAVRVAVLDELDPDRRTAAGRARAAAPGPYFGFVGAVSPGAVDPRGAEVWVTGLEAAARCPWQMFLSRVLRLEPVPDLGAELPPFSGAVLGSAVHAALERIARGGEKEAPATVAEAAATPPRTVAWPADEELERVLGAAAEAALRDEGLALPLLVRGLAERVRPFVDAAHRTDFAAPTSVAGVELVGGATVADAAGRARLISFRADRADVAGGALILTDYKTGRGLTQSAQDRYKRRALLMGIAGGQVLQAAAYAAAGGGVAGGRYLFLRPEMEDGARDVAAGADGEVLGAFRTAVAVLLEVRDTGAFFPRLVTADGRAEGPGCGGCAFREACLVGDTGARRRLLAWTAAAGVDAPADPQVRAAWRAWRLGTNDAEGEGRA